jgi:riboflavin kinase/FMN adenylyltransferase
MPVLHDAWNSSQLPQGTVGTVGNFDGVHRGQQAILEMVVRRGLDTGLVPVTVTFEPHPLQILGPEAAPLRLTTPRQKVRLLSSCGIETILVLTFDEKLSRVSAREFVEDFLFDRLDMQEIYVGSRFTFCHGREGNLRLLKEVALANRRRVVGVAEVVEGQTPISSTRIRDALRRGDVTGAADLLGRPYSLAGRVVRGAAQGKELGWPTINLDLENELLPASGVYRSRVRIGEGNERLPAVTNVGFRPTLHRGSELTVESHILDFRSEIYGSPVELEFLDRLRGERRFGSTEELVEQIARDVEEVRRRFSRELLRLG